MPICCLFRSVSHQLYKTDKSPCNSTVNKQVTKGVARNCLSRNSVTDQWIDRVNNPGGAFKLFLLRFLELRDVRPTNRS
jgi:hypothetical protein